MHLVSKQGDQVDSTLHSSVLTVIKFHNTEDIKEASKAGLGGQVSTWRLTVALCKHLPLMQLEAGWMMVCQHLPQMPTMEPNVPIRIMPHYTNPVSYTVPFGFQLCHLVVHLLVKQALLHTRGTQSSLTQD